MSGPAGVSRAAFRDFGQRSAKACTVLPSINAACVFCGATNMNSCSCRHWQTVSKKCLSHFKVWLFPAPGTPCSRARDGSDRKGLAVASSAASAKHRRTTCCRKATRARRAPLQLLQPRAGRLRRQPCVHASHAGLRQRICRRWRLSGSGGGRPAGIWYACTPGKVRRSVLRGTGAPLLDNVAHGRRGARRVLEAAAFADTVNSVDVHPLRWAGELV